MAPEVPGQHPRVAPRREHSGQTHDPHGMSSYPDDSAAMRARFDEVRPLTVGLEEEVMLVDPGTLDLLPLAKEVVERAADPRFKTELPAAQLEIMLPPTMTVGESVA